MKKSNELYAVCNDGQAVMVTDDLDRAEAYAEEMTDREMRCTAEDMDIDLDDEDDVSRAAYANGYDGGLYMVGTVKKDGDGYIADLETQEIEITEEELRCLLGQDDD